MSIFSRQLSVKRTPHRFTPFSQHLSILVKHNPFILRLSSAAGSKMAEDYSEFHKISLPRSEFPPPVNRDMKELDRSFFQREIPLVVARLDSPSYITSFVKSARKDILQLKGIGHVVHLDQGQAKGVLLSHKITDPATARSFLSNESNEILTEAKATLLPYQLVLDYDYWRTEEILGAILPVDLLDEIPSGFSIVGHIAHLNVRDQYAPYKKLIGQVVLDKNPRIETVVNKLDSIDTTFRTFSMEVLAGRDDFMAEQSESNCRFRFDFSKVYWNSRLHTEHARLVEKFMPGEAVCDVFAGVGPFAVPAGKKEVIVFANDLNPFSYQYLKENIALNKVGSFVKSFNEDGREFIKSAVEKLYNFSVKQKSIQGRVKRRKTKKSEAGKEVEKEANEETGEKLATLTTSTADKPVSSSIDIPLTFSHYVMNLPDTAINFLGGFIGLYNDENLRSNIFQSKPVSLKEMPLIHVHCFHKYEPHQPEPEDEEIHQNLRDRVAENLQYDIELRQLSFHRVRKVAPTKIMYCITFRLPLEVALAKEN